MTMREIVHRGKRKDNGEWVYGSLVIANDPINAGKCFILQSTSDFSCGGDQGERIRIGCFAEVDPETTGEYTGLIDKNRKRVFEGDVLVINEAWHYPVCVKFTEFSWECHSPTHKLYRHRLEANQEKYEVIGNIYDNPELLGGAGAE